MQKSLPRLFLVRHGETEWSLSGQHSGHADILLTLNGESPQQISDRVDRLIAKLVRLHGNVALFTHGHLGRVLGARWIGMSIELADRLLLDTASLSILSHQHNQASERAIALWNSPSRGWFE